MQDEMLISLSDTVAKMQNTLDLQQAQLRILYNKMQQQTENDHTKPYSLADEIPPHY